MNSMFIANVSGRLSLLTDETDAAEAIDVAEVSGGRFGPAPADAYERWDDFSTWLRQADLSSSPRRAFAPDELLTPVPTPSQIFAIGLNYADHAAEARMELPENLIVFTKFGSSLAGAVTEVALTGPTMDWEAELVVVMGRSGRSIDEADAWDHVAGLAVGQDLSDRTVQSRGKPAQFSLGKSFAGFAPVGPVLPLSAVEHRDSLRVHSTVTVEGGEERVLQDGTTADMVFSVPAIIARLSDVVELRAGDLIFTGTPSGVGLGRDPQEFLAAGSTLHTGIDQLYPITQKITD